MLSYLKARAGELSSILSASGAAGIIGAYLLGQIDGRHAIVGLLVAAVAYLMPQDKATAQAIAAAILDAQKSAKAILLALALGSLLTLQACGNSAQVASGVATALASPAGQALLAMVESFAPGVGSVIAKINGGLSVGQSDLQMACGAVSELDGAYKLFAPSFGATAADNQAEAATMAAVETACSGKTTDIASAVQTVLAAYQSFTAVLQNGGVPVTAAAAAPAAQ